MSAHALKFVPGSASHSMANSGQRLATPATSSPSLNGRFRDAVVRYKTATAASSADVAELIGVDLTKFNHWMKTSGARPVTLAAVQAVEGLAQSVRAGVDDAEVVQAAREKARADANWERVLRALMEGAA